MNDYWKKQKHEDNKKNEMVKTLKDYKGLDKKKLEEQFNSLKNPYKKSNDKHVKKLKMPKLYLNEIYPKESNNNTSDKKQIYITKNKKEYISKKLTDGKFGNNIKIRIKNNNKIQLTRNSSESVDKKKLKYYKNKKKTYFELKKPYYEYKKSL